MHGMPKKKALGGKYIGCWATLQDYEKITGKKIRTFSQSPFLDDRNLPPVKERISEEPLVVWPLEGIGRYGGMMKVLSIYGCFSNPRILSHDRDYKR